MKVSNDILGKLAKRTINYFKNDLQMNGIDETFKIQEVNSVEFLDITTLVSLSKDLIGTVAMSVSLDLSKKMVENFIYGKLDEETISQLASENVAETLNITLGNIIQDLEVVSQGGHVEISTPYTMHNQVGVTKKENGHMYLCTLNIGDEDIILSYFI